MNGEINIIEQLLWRPLSPVSYVLQVFLIGSVLAVALRLVPATHRLASLVLGFSAWFAVIWLLTLPRCSVMGLAALLATLFGGVAAVSAYSLANGGALRGPWFAGAALVVAHFVHLGVTSSFNAVMCL